MAKNPASTGSLTVNWSTTIWVPRSLRRLHDHGNKIMLVNMKRNFQHVKNMEFRWRTGISLTHTHWWSGWWFPGSPGSWWRHYHLHNHLSIRGFLVADTRLYTLPCRSVGTSVRWSHFLIASGFHITAPAQPSATGLPCIRPCSELILNLQVAFPNESKSSLTENHKHFLAAEVNWKLVIRQSACHWLSLKSGENSMDDSGAN